MDRNAVHQQHAVPCRVALRKESVDRNTVAFLQLARNLKSLSARRAWIEITAETPKPSTCAGRSPQGERG